MYREFDGIGEELSDSELELLDSVLRMFPGDGGALEKLDNYIAHEVERCRNSSDGKWHWEALADLEAIRAKITGDSSRGAGVDWDEVDRIMGSDD